MSNVQFIMNFDKKMALVRDAAKLDLPMSVLLRRLVDVYLTDPNVRQKVINFNSIISWKDDF